MHKIKYVVDTKISRTGDTLKSSSTKITSDAVTFKTQSFTSYTLLQAFLQSEPFLEAIMHLMQCNHWSHLNLGCILEVAALQLVLHPHKEIKLYCCDTGTAWWVVSTTVPCFVGCCCTTSHWYIWAISWRSTQSLAPIFWDASCELLCTDH
jgi:hypothetical protein